MHCDSLIQAITATSLQLRISLSGRQQQGSPDTSGDDSCCLYFKHTSGSCCRAGIKAGHVYAPASNMLLHCCFGHMHAAACCTVSAICRSCHFCHCTATQLQLRCMAVGAYTDTHSKVFEHVPGMQRSPLSQSPPSGPQYHLITQLKRKTAANHLS
jgi:hypothetical protein